MLNKHVVLPVVFLCVSVFAHAEENTLASAVVSGKISADDVDNVIISSHPPAIDDGWSVATHPDDLQISVTPAKTFHATLPVTGPGFHRLNVGKSVYDLYLTPGARVGWEQGIDGELSRFSDDHAASNQHMLDLGKAVEAAHTRLLDEIRKVYALDLQAFLAEIDRREQVFVANHKNWIDLHPDAPIAVVQRLQVDIQDQFDRYRLLYPTLFRNITGTLAKVPENYYQELLSTVKPQDLYSRPMVAFLDTYVNLESAGELKFGDQNTPREKLVSRYLTIKQMAVGSSARDYLLEQMFNAFDTNYGPADWGKVRGMFEKDFPGHHLLVEVNAMHQQAMAIRSQADEIRVFRQVNGLDLEAHVFYPPNHKSEDRRSVFVTFHGGGWAIGTPEWSYPIAQRMAELGMVAISFEYRLADVHGTDMAACVDDTRAAIAWVRQFDDELGIDTTKLVAHGFSAGAHLAGINAILNPDKSLDVHARPDALILHSSTYNTLKSGFFTVMTKGNPESVSLTHQVKPGLVPTLLIHGKYDHLAPEAEFMEFVEQMKAHKNDFEYHLFDVGHFFRNPEIRKQADQRIDEFLTQRGFMVPE